MFNVQVRLDDRALKQLMSDFPDKVDDAIASFAFDGQAWVQDQIGSDGSPSAEGGFPGIDTGTLKNSFTVEPAGEMARRIVTAVEYAIHLEFGTSKMEARPFMLPLASWMEREAETAMRSYLRF